jgi:phosphate acetyltransferase
MADFLTTILAKAAANLKTIVLPEGHDNRTLEAAQVIVDKKIAKLIILGDPDDMAPKLGKALDSGWIELMKPTHHPLKKELAEQLYEIRKHKGMNQMQADVVIADEMYFGTMLVKTGRADGLVSGATHSTADTVRPALQIIKPAEGNKTVSSMFFMCFPDVTYMFADCGLVQDPNESELADIAVSTAKTAFQFGFEPRIAMLSYSTKGSAKGDGAAKVVMATERAKATLDAIYGGKVVIDGELQFDAAFVPDIAAKKCPNSPLKGMANTFIFPDLGAGNICYKATQRLAGAEAYGPVLQGLAKPVNDLSRGCNSDDIVATVAVTALQAADL